MFQRRVILLVSSASSSTAEKGALSSYGVLGVKPNTPFDEVKARFQKLAQFHHPDMPHGDAGKFREINAAYRLLRAAHRERRSATINANVDSSKFWAQHNSEASRGGSYSYQKYTTQSDCRSSSTAASSARHGGLVREILWLYEGYEIGLILCAAVVVLIFGAERCITVYNLTKENKRKRVAMEEGLPPLMPLELDSSLMQAYNVPVSQREIKVDEAVAKEMAYYRRATQRRFEDFREFLFVHNADVVTSRKITTSRMAVQYIDESLIPSRCPIIKTFNSEMERNKYDSIVKDVVETVRKTSWSYEDAHFILPLIAQGLSAIPMNSPDMVKWTFVEYQQDEGTSKTPDCLIALKNEKFDRLGMCQRVKIQENDRLKSKRRAEDGKHIPTRSESLQTSSGAPLPLRDMSVSLERMSL